MCNGECSKDELIESLKKDLFDALQAAGHEHARADALHRRAQALEGAEHRLTTLRLSHERKERELLARAQRAEEKSKKWWWHFG